MKAPLGLRARVTLTYVIGAMLVSAFLAVSTWTVTSQIMLRQRLALSERQAWQSATEVGLALDRGVPPADALAALDSGLPIARLVDLDGALTSSPMPAGRSVPDPDALPAGEGTATWTTIEGQRATLVAADLSGGRGVLYELTEATELNATLATLAGVLVGSVIVTVVLAAATGVRVSQRTLQPLRRIGLAAEQIGAGRLSHRLERTRDPDLDPIVDSFNAMVDALDSRIQRDARFAADVSHELRTPLTTLIASADLLTRRRQHLDDRARATLALMKRELERLRSAMEHLIDLGRLESDTGWDPAPVDLLALVRRAVVAEGCDPGLVVGVQAAVVTDADAVTRAIGNLIRNADVHGGGVTSITVGIDGSWAVVHVRDRGPGVADDDRERVFERFVRAGARGDRPGSGLGLSIVRETMHRAGGSVSLAETDHGATFVLRIPRRDQLGPGG